MHIAMRAIHLGTGRGNWGAGKGPELEHRCAQVAKVAKMQVREEITHGR